MIRLGLILGMIITFFISCKENKSEEYTYLSGNIENQNSDTLFITEFYGDSAFKVFKVKDGEVIRDSALLPMAYYRIGDGTESTVCFLKPSFDINISLNTKEFDESLKYSGKGAVENNYLAEKFLLEENFSELNYYGYYGELNEAKFVKLTDSLYNLRLNLFNKYKNNFDEDFLFIEYKNIQIDYLLKYTDFEGIHRFVTGDKDFKVSDTFFNPYDSIDVNNERLLLLPNYINFVNSYIRKLTSDLLKNNDTIISIDIYNNTFIDIVDTLIKNKNVRQEVAYYFGKYDFNSMKEPEYSYQKLKSIIFNKEYLTLIEKTYNKINRIKKGKVSPTFELFDVDSNLVKLEDLKGKIVYVDIWSLWCLPCRKEVPYLEELEAKYKDDNIAFVSICKDDTRTRWRKSIIASELNGIQLFAPDNNIAFFEDYMVDGVPRYILIDKKGYIIDSDAPRPSSKDIDKLFNKLLH